jgi:acetyl-CoA acyltransferase
MEISMPASLRDVRVVSPAVNLPRPLAAALLIAGCGFAEQHGLIPRARFRALAIAGMDPVVPFTAILDATRKALQSAGLGVDDIGLFNVYESCVGVPLIAQGEFGIPGRQAQHQRRLHRHRAPRPAQPARMLTDLPCEPERSQSRHGLQAICGTASAAVIERQ